MALPALVGALLAASARGEQQPLVLEAHPTAGGLQRAAADLQRAVAHEPDRDVTIHLRPGVHSVPPGGLRLTEAHSPAPGRTVRWVGQGAAAISGAVPVSGWKPANDPKMPAGVQVAPAPAGLRGTSARHLWVDGVRASRTRKLLSDALPQGTHLSLAADGSGYTLGAGGSGGGRSCSADHGKNTPCCGQPHAPGTTVPPRYQCPASQPTCQGYVYMSHCEPCTSLLCPCPHESVIDAWACAQTATALAALPPPRARTQAWAGSTRTRWSLCTPAWRRGGRRRAAR